MRPPKVIQLLLLLVAVLLCPALTRAQADSAQENAGLITGSISQLRDSRRVILMVHRSNVVDSRGLAKSILKEVYSEDTNSRVRYPRLYNLLARKLNDYMKRYQSITAVKNVSEADFIVLFNLVEYRRPLGFSYPYGEMFVIYNNRTSGKPPQIVWKTRKSPVWAEDAIKDFIKELKAVRGEG